MSGIHTRSGWRGLADLIVALICAPISGAVKAWKRRKESKHE